MRRYVDYCFYGLLLIFLDLNFNGQVGQVDLLSDALGIWLVSYGLYALQRVDQRLQRAFYWSLLYLLVDVIWEVSNWAGWLKFHPLLGGGMTVLVIGLMLLTFYEMLGGLSWEAEKSGLNELGETLERWRGYMVVIYLAGIIALLPFFILRIAWGVLWLILFLQLGHLVSQCSKQLPNELEDQPQEKAIWTLLPVLVIGLVLGIVLSIMGNLPQTIEVPYMAATEQETAEVTALRQQLLELGLPEQVVNDFDAEEIRRYQGVWKVTGKRETAARDTENDMTMILERYVCYLPEGKARYIGAYRYLQPPEHAYSGMMDLYYYDHGLSFLLGEADDVQSLQLFERQGKTYRTLPILGKDKVGHAYTGLRLEFGLPRQGEAVRGYMLVDCRVDWHNITETWLALEYWQQTKLRHGQFDLQGSQCFMMPEGYERQKRLTCEEVYYVAHPELLND